jgi:hypothetical protein
MRALRPARIIAWRKRNVTLIPWLSETCEVHYTSHRGRATICATTPRYFPAAIALWERDQCCNSSFGEEALISSCQIIQPGVLPWQFKAVGHLFC